MNPPVCKAPRLITSKPPRYRQPPGDSLGQSRPDVVRGFGDVIAPLMAKLEPIVRDLSNAFGQYLSAALNNLAGLLDYAGND